MQRLIYTTLLALLIWAHPSHADPLQDRIESALEAFGGLIPHAPDVGLVWASVLVGDAIKQANPSATVLTTEIGAWIVANQPVDADPALRKQRAEWLASAFKQVMRPNTVYPDALPAQTIGVAELKLRIDTALDKVIPGPTKEEMQAEQTKVLLREQEVDRIAAEHKRQWE